MLIKHLEVLNELGLHARVASRVVRECKKYQSSVVVEKEGKTFDLKNVTGVITVNAKRGDVLTVKIDGLDEPAAAAAVEELFLNKFGER